FGDQLATILPNGTAFLPGGGTQVFNTGMTFPAGTTFSVPVILNNGQTLPAGQALPSTQIIIPILGFLGSPSASSASTPSSHNALAGTAIALLTRGAFKIADNESPRPQDRVFVNYNYFDRILGTSVDLNRETLGFEKTFLDGNASVGMRVP